jgi:ABC-type dipeptide/oligopeptide/nickel transport system permease component
MVFVSLAGASMKQYLLRRLGRLILAWLGVTLITFLQLRLTGNSARVVLSQLAIDEAIKEFNRRSDRTGSWGI